MAVVIPARFRQRDLEKIDELVKSGIFKSRSEAIRSLTVEGTDRRYVELMGSDISDAVKAILNVLKEDRNGLRITLKGKVSGFIAEGRERL